MIGEDAMRTLGKPVRRVRVTAVAVALGFAGCAGGLYASHMRYLDPTQFTVWESVLVLAMAILGGLGTVRGALAGTATFVVVPELLRFIGLPSTVAAPLRQVLFGVLLIVMLRLRPTGLLGRKDLGWLAH